MASRCCWIRTREVFPFQDGAAIRGCRVSLQSGGKAPDLFGQRQRVGGVGARDAQLLRFARHRGRGSFYDDRDGSRRVGKRSPWTRPQREIDFFVLHLGGSHSWGRERLYPFRWHWKWLRSVASFGRSLLDAYRWTTICSSQRHIKATGVGKRQSRIRSLSLSMGVAAI